MPFVLRHRDSQEIATATLINNYNIPYWGAKVWESMADAELEKADFLNSIEVNDAEHDTWEFVEVEESKVKMMNVKLNNQSNRRVHMNEQGQLSVVK